MSMRRLALIAGCALLTACGGGPRDEAEAGDGASMAEAGSEEHLETPEEILEARKRYKEQAQAALDIGSDPVEERLGFADGEHVREYPDGRKVVMNFKDGRMDGAYLRTYADGAKEIETTYKDGEKHGAYKSWYADGQQFEEGTYVAGERDGVWTTWYQNGEVLAKGEYDDGKLMKTYAAKLADGTEIVLEDIPHRAE